MLIRNMEEKDLDAVYEIECATFSKPWSMTDFKESLSDVHNLYLVVEENEKIIAYCGMWGVVDEGQINNVAVEKKHRGKGIGYSMLKELIEKGKTKGLVAFTLEVRVNNKPAVTLYEKLGFKSAGIRKNFYEEPTEDALIMWLS